MELLALAAGAGTANDPDRGFWATEIGPDNIDYDDVLADAGFGCSVIHARSGMDVDTAVAIIVIISLLFVAFLPAGRRRRK